ncbi:hypothetical protein SDC9_57525 [bioreactor metagenome]|uniref:Thioredoxin domain-containing protein n=1 Tax=bioreactor metagenome TaxID=1076179 RepID=A0A644X4V0_9ZZZZ
MKSTILSIAVFLLALVQMQAQSDTAKLLVYDFHITHRCATCQKIEETTVETLNNYYKAQLDSGIIVFKTFNCELEENAELVKKYSAYGSTLVLTRLWPDGKEVIVDITDIAFSKIGKPELFVEKLREKIDELMMLQ